MLGESKYRYSAILLEKTKNCCMKFAEELRMKKLLVNSNGGTSLKPQGPTNIQCVSSERKCAWKRKIQEQCNFTENAKNEDPGNSSMVKRGTL